MRHRGVSDSPFRRPPVISAPSGRLRRASFAIELAGLEPGELAEVVGERFGGRVEVSDAPCWRIEGALGEFRIELVSATGEESGTEALRIVTPEIPLPRLSLSDTLRQVLRDAGAVSPPSPVLRIAVEAPSLETESVLLHLRAFLLLYDWIATHQNGHASSAGTPFPHTYVRRVMEPTYAPSRERLIEDYLEHSPVADRPLDLLPLFAYLESDVGGGRWISDQVDPRPVYCYRTSSCCIEDPEWRIADEWNLWVRIERLAADPERLETMRAAYAEFLDAPLSFLRTSWSERVRRWL